MPLGRPLLNTLERMNYGGVLLDSAGRVLAINGTGQQLLQAECGADETDASRSAAAGRSAVESRSAVDYRNAIKDLLARGTSRFQMDGENWFVVPRGERRSLVLHAIAIAEPTTEGPHTVLILIDLDAAAQPRTEVLKTVFGLTAGEAKLAVEIGRGHTPGEVARENGVSQATVRSQLGSIYAKTGTRRQAELVALLARLAILP